MLAKYFQSWICALFFIFPLSFAGCSKPFQSKKPIFVYVAKEREQSFHESIFNGVKKQMAKKGLRVDIFAAKNQKDFESQHHFLEMIRKEKNYTGVMISPNDSEKLIEDVRLLDKEKIPFVLIDTLLKENEVTRGFKYFCGYVGTDNLLVGEMAFNFLFQKIEQGTVVMVRGIHTHRSSVDRELGFVGKNEKTKPPFKLEYILGDWTGNKAYESFVEFMKKSKKKVDGVFAYNDHMALGVSRWYDEHPKFKRPIIVGVDGTVVGQKGLLEKKIDAIVVQATELMGIEGLNLIVDCVGNESVRNRNILTPATLLTATTTLQRSSP